MTDTPNPWKTTNSKIVYQNPWISVREDKVIQPDGYESIFGVTTISPGIAILPVDDENNVYLVKQYRYAAARVTVETIGGGCREGETPEEGARRELREETGLLAKEFTPLGFVNPLTSVVDCIDYLYLAHGLSHGEDDRDLTELLEIIKVPYQQALDWVMGNTITHGPSVATILKARDLLLKP